MWCGSLLLTTLTEDNKSLKTFCDIIRKRNVNFLSVLSFMGSTRNIISVCVTHIWDYEIVCPCVL